MKKSLLLITLSALLFIAGCSTTSVPSTPKPHPEKYALQILKIGVPSPGTAMKSSIMLPQDIDALLKNPSATISEFPIVYAAVGETAINDQTETLSFPTIYEPQTDSNGVVSVVYNHHKDIKIGQYVEMTLQKVESGQATCDLWFFDKSLAGSFTYEVAPATKVQDAVTATLPKFKALETKTEVTLVPGAWISMGGLTGTKKEGDQSTPTTIYFAIRILPPQK